MIHTSPVPDVEIPASTVHHAVLASLEADPGRVARPTRGRAR